MSSHLLHKSIWVLNLQYSQRGVGRFKKKKASGGFYASCIGCRSLLISRQVCESAKRQKTQNMKYLTAELVPWLHQYVACNCNRHLRTASTHWSSSETAPQNEWVSDAACDHSPWLRVLLGLALVQLSTHNPPPPPPHHTPYRGSALCQPWTGTYYRSCWNDGF